MYHHSLLRKGCSDNAETWSVLLNTLFRSMVKSYEITHTDRNAGKDIFSCFILMNNPVPTVAFLADTALYQPINEFLLLKPGIDTGNTPEFYKLFNSSAEKYKMERLWMLQLLEDGLRETADYHIFERRNTFKLLLSFYDSALSDDVTQVCKILQIFLHAFIGAISAV